MGSCVRQIYNKFKREVKARYLQSHWRGYRALKTFQCCIHAVLIIQCAGRCYISRILLRARRSEARNLSQVLQERDRLRQEAQARQNELEKVKEESGVNQAQISEAVSCRSAAKSRETDVEIKSLRDALEQLTEEKESGDNELKEATKMLVRLQLAYDQLEVENSTLVSKTINPAESMEETKKDPRQLEQYREYCYQADVIRFWQKAVFSDKVKPGGRRKSGIPLPSPVRRTLN